MPWPGSVLRVTRVIRFNAFDMNCVAHQSPGLWRHPHDQSWRYKDLTYWTELAKLLERGRFDGLFIADVLGTYDIYGASDEAATDRLRRSRSATRFCLSQRWRW
jgi:long-chain alkane monooxygenase